MAGVVGWVQRFASRLRYPQLFALLATLFVIDLMVPDMIPFADEILLGLLTLVAARFKPGSGGGGDDEPEKPPEKNVTPPGGHHSSH